VRTTYGLAANDQKSIDTVIDALIKYNNALKGTNDYNGEKVTLITNRDLIFTGKQYFLPDPDSLNKLITNPGADAGDVVRQSMAKGQNRSVAQGESQGPTPYTFGATGPGGPTNPGTPTQPPPTAQTGRPGETVSLLGQDMLMVVPPPDSAIPGSVQASYAGLDLDTSTFGIRDFSRAYGQVTGGADSNSGLAGMGIAAGSAAGAAIGGQ
jgi:hypothetical protein